MRSRSWLPLLLAAACCGAHPGAGGLAGSAGHPTGGGDDAIAARDLDQLVLSPTGACGVTRDRRARCWGGWDGTTLNVGVPAAGLRDVVALAIGHELLTDPQPHYDHLCALDGAGAVRCWGNNRQGQLGTGDRDDAIEPTVIAGLGETAQLALGEHHTCALDRAGAVRCWGSNERGQLGVGRGLDVIARPTPVPGLAGVVQLAATADNTCALTGDHRVLCWGDNLNGQSAVRADPFEPVIASPRELAAARGATRLAAGESTLCAIGARGAITCWGYVKNVLDPGRADAVVEDLDDVQAIALGDEHGCALRRGGQVWCFGSNEHGQLGNRTIGAARQRPAQVDLPGPATAIAAAGWDSCARLADRGWLCWGGNLHGEIGPREVTPEPMGGAPATFATPHPTPALLDPSQLP